MSEPTISYKNHRFPHQIIADAVWLYFRVPLSLRLVEEMLLERGIVVSYETIRRWSRKFGAAHAKQLRKKKPSRKDIWHLDEVAISIRGRKHWLWRAVDQDGYVLDEIVQARRDTRSANRLLVRLLRKQGLTPKRNLTDKLRSYGAARRDVMPAVEHRSHKGLNNRAENSHVPLRKGERMSRASDLSEACNVSSRPFKQSKISSSHGITNAQPWPPTFIEFAQWRSGKS